VSPAGLEILKKCRTLPFSKIQILKTTPAQGRVLFVTVLECVERTIERELKTLPYYLTLRPSPE
jgi:hypothetical protein